VNRQLGHRVAAGAAGVARRAVHPGQQLTEAGVVAAGRQGVDDVFRQHLLARRALNVHRRRVAGDGDRLGQLAHAHLGVDGDDGLARQADAVALDGGESLQRERHGVLAATQIDDAVLPRPVRDRRARLLDQHRAGGFDRDAGNDGAGGVADDAGESPLRKRRGDDERARERERSASSRSHEHCSSLY
jgi:hypothetical protein